MAGKGSPLSLRGLGHEVRKGSEGWLGGAGTGIPAWRWVGCGSFLVGLAGRGPLSQRKPMTRG